MGRLGIKWEDIGECAAELMRIKVPGGWLVSTSYNGEDVSICFYPDSEHKWLKSPS